MEEYYTRRYSSEEFHQGIVLPRCDGIYYNVGNFIGVTVVYFSISSTYKDRSTNTVFIYVMEHNEKDYFINNIMQYNARILCLLRS